MFPVLLKVCAVHFAPPNGASTDAAHTAMFFCCFVVPPLSLTALLQDQYQPSGHFRKTKVAFCVHNIAYQVCCFVHLLQQSAGAGINAALLCATSVQGACLTLLQQYLVTCIQLAFLLYESSVQGANLT